MKKFQVLLFLGFLFLCSGTVFSQIKKDSNSSKKSSSQVQIKDTLQTAGKKAEKFAVAPFKDTLFYVHNKIGSFTAHNRAKAISGRIMQLYEEPFFESDSLTISEADISLDIVYKKDFVIMSITDLDAKSAASENRDLAQKNLSIINKAILFQKKNNSDLNWLKRIGLELVFVSLIALLLFVANRLFRRLKLYLIQNEQKYFKPLKLKNSNLFSPNKQLLFGLKLIGMIRFAVLFFIVYLSLPLLFSVFPETKGYADILLNWILKPARSAFMGFLNFLPNLFSILVIVFLFRYALKAIKYFVEEIQKGSISIDGFYSDWAMPTFNIIKVLLYAFMVVLIFPYLPGSNSPIFKGISVFIGILFSLGSSNAIANMVAGLVITYMRPFKIGDFVKIGEVKGVVIEKTTLVTRIRTPKQEDITIPNATVLSSSAINFSANTENSENGLVIHTTVTIGYDVPWKKIHQALITAALRSDLLEKTPPPFVLQTSLDDFYVSYEINAYTKSPNQQSLIYSLLHQNIQDCFNEEGIEIMSPHYKAWRDGNNTTIPENYLGKENKEPVFTANN